MSYYGLKSIRLLSLFILLALAACNTSDIRNLSAIARSSDPGATATKVLQQKGQYYAAHPEQLAADIRAFKRVVGSIWGDENVQEPGPRDYVKYTDKYYNRAHIDFEAGTVTVETVAPGKQREYLKKAIVTTLLTPDDPRKVDLYTDSTPAPSGKPFLYQQVLDQDGKPIQWQWRAGRYADYLIKNKLTRIKIGTHNGLRVVFPLVAGSEQIRAYKYASIVRKYSDKYRITESLIYGIIKTESEFNPFAVSPAPAYGLMQIVPATAGRDVYDKLKNRSGQPSANDLYDPDNNIDIGAGYLSILQNNYLAGIRDNNSMRYSMIAAYNGGAGNALNTFSTDRSQAISRINGLSSDQVFRQLTTSNPSVESRRYLYKVNEAQKEFWANNGFSGK